MAPKKANEEVTGRYGQETHQAMPERIVCAAQRHRYTGELLLGIRHFDEQMGSQLERNGQSDVDYQESGFLTNKNRFVDRKEAWVIASRENQILRDVETSPGALFSEHLY